MALKKSEKIALKLLNVLIDEEDVRDYASVIRVLNSSTLDELLAKGYIQYDRDNNLELTSVGESVVS